MKAKIEQGLREAREGKLSDGDAFFDELDREEGRAPSGRKTA